MLCSRLSQKETSTLWPEMLWVEPRNAFQVNGGKLPPKVTPFCIGGAVFGALLPLLSALLEWEASRLRRRSSGAGLRLRAVSISSPHTDCILFAMLSCGMHAALSGTSYLSALQKIGNTYLACKLSYSLTKVLTSSSSLYANLTIALLGNFDRPYRFGLMLYQSDVA